MWNNEITVRQNYRAKKECRSSESGYNDLRFQYIKEYISGYIGIDITLENIKKELYHLRWRIESKYRELKNRLQLEAFQEIKPNQDSSRIFTAMFFSNLAAILKRDADTQILKQKHRYQTNRSYLLNRIKAKIIPLLQASISLCKRMIIQLIKKASKVRSILRPNQTFGRY